MRCKAYGSPVLLVLLVRVALVLTAPAGCGKVLYADSDGGAHEAALGEVGARDAALAEGPGWDRLRDLPDLTGRDHQPDRSPWDLPGTDGVLRACAQPGPCLLTMAGTGKDALTNGAVLESAFNLPTAVGVGAQGAAFVVDFGNSVIRRIHEGVVTTFAGSVSGNALGALSDAQFSFPEDLSVQGSTIYVADTKNHSIRELTLTEVKNVAGAENGFRDGPVATARFDEPCGVTHDSAGVIYAADRTNNVIRKIEAGVVSTLVGDGTPGDKDGEAGSARLSGPAAVALDAAGKLYIADTGNNRIKVYDPGTGSVARLAGDGRYGYADDSSPLLARFGAPEGIVATPDGVTVYVADTGNHCIRRIAVGVGGAVTTVAGQCTVEGFADGPATTQALLNLPHGLSLTEVPGSAALYIADSMNHRIRQFVP